VAAAAAKLDPEQFPGALFRWEQRVSIPAKEVPPMEMVIHPVSSCNNDPDNLELLEALFKDYGVRTSTIVKFLEMGFTVSTLVNMTEPEIDDVVKTIADCYQVEFLVGERYGVKAAIRAVRRRQEDENEQQRLQCLGKKPKLDEYSGVASTPTEGEFSSN
jgi:hypothetical protein